ncbi:MAG: hypothetical protein ABEI77_06100 [Halorientalis sp.]
MEFVWRVRLVTVGVMLFVLLVSGPAVGLVDFTPQQHDPTSLGGGTANVTMVSDPASQIRITEGRFGTGVYYLRVSPAVVDVAAIDGRPQLTYKLSVPRLDYTASTSKQLATTGTGRTKVSLSDRAFAPNQLKYRSYRAEVIVRVQSFDEDEVIYHRNVTLSVDR